jgi:hypothetical protein
VSRGRIAFLSVLALAVGGWRADAEPIFLSRQYTRCTNCHYSPTGGGLLTPYGRSLSREELSTFGASRASGALGREQDFLFGALGKGLGPVSVGLDLRPSHLSIDSTGYSSSRDFLMNAAVAAALQYRKWTFYGQVGRQPRGDETRVTSFEHWVMYQSDRGLGFRVGRFLPAYGVRLADHTTFTRATRGFDNDDQIYGAEMSYKATATWCSWPPVPGGPSLSWPTTSKALSPPRGAGSSTCAHARRSWRPAPTGTLPTSSPGAAPPASPWASLPPRA